MKAQKTIQDINLQQEEEFNEYWLDIFSARAKGKSYEELEKETEEKIQKVEAEKKKAQEKIQKVEAEKKKAQEKIKKAETEKKKAQEKIQTAIKNLLLKSDFTVQQIAQILTVSVKQVKDVKKEIEQ